MSKSKGYTHKITLIKPNQFIKILKLFGFKSKSFNGGSHVKMTKKSIKLLNCCCQTWQSRNTQF